MSLSAPDIKRSEDRRGRLLRPLLLALAVLLAITSAWLYWDNTRLVTTHYSVKAASQSTKSHEKIRVVQVSDLHTHSHGKQNTELIAEIRAQNPDVIAITGDLISFDTSKAGVDTMVRLASELDSIAPTYFVSGNHEVDSPYGELLYSKLEKADITVLRNETEAVKIRGERLQIMGVDDPLEARSAGAMEPTNDIVAASINKAKSDPDYGEGRPSILLAHRPDADQAYADSGLDVALVGHNHGGQIRLPLIGGLVSPNRTLLPGQTDGATKISDGTTMVISRGLGNSTMPLRVNNPFELVVVDLEI